MILIGFGHVARTGKDTCAKLLADDHGFTIVAFADALREFVIVTHPHIAGIIDEIGWEHAKETNPQVRKTLVDVGNAAREIMGRDVWIRAAFERLGERTAVTDVRYLNEVEAIKGRGGYVVKVIRPGYEALPNIADQALVDFESWDAQIVNDGSVEDLRLQLDELVSRAMRDDFEE